MSSTVRGIGDTAERIGKQDPIFMTVIFQLRSVMSCNGHRVDSQVLHTRGWESLSGEVSFALKLKDKKPPHEDDKEGE